MMIKVVEKLFIEYWNQVNCGKYYGMAGVKSKCLYRFPLLLKDKGVAKEKQWYNV